MLGVTFNGHSKIKKSIYLGTSMKSQVDLVNSIGKTISSVKWDVGQCCVVIFYTDSTFSILAIDPASFEVAPYLYDLPLQEHTTISFLVEAGIYTSGEMREMQYKKWEDQLAAERLEREIQERKEYYRLCKKYGRKDCE